MPKKPKPRPVPLGAALPRPDDALEGLALFGPSDIADVEAWQQKHAPAPFGDVLNPQTEVEDA